MKLVPPKKIRILEFKNFSTALLLESKSLEVIFCNETLDQATLSELKELINWCTLHTEVKSIYITSQNENFIQGLNYESLKNADTNLIANLYKDLQTINQGLVFLPQTIVVDLKNGATNEALTMALAADIRIANSDAQFQFNEINFGFINNAGLFSILNSKLNSATLRSLTLAGSIFGVNELNALGGFTFINKSPWEILANINKQSSIARVQTKCALIGMNDQLELHQNFVEKLFAATLYSEDFKQEKEFVNFREFKEKFSEQFSN